MRCIQISKILSFFIWIILNGFYLSAADPPLLDLHQLTANEFSVERPAFVFLQNQIVHVTGFWYPISSDHGVLATMPNLKSCCVKVPAKIYQQLIVKGDISDLPAQKAITLEGIFKIDPKYSLKGQLIQFYVLEQPKVIQQTTSIFLTALCLIGGVLAYITFFIVKYFR